MLQAVVFDFDGVIVDSEPLHHQAFEMVLKEEGISYSWDEYQERFIGFDDRDGFREMFLAAERALDEGRLPELIDQKAECFARLISESDVRTYPGVVDLVQSLSGALPLALCSGALRSDVEPVLARLGLDDCFDAIVTAEDVKKSKPDPESYALALTRLKERYPQKDIEPGFSLAVEDTPTGIASARSAGLIVLGLANTHDEEFLDEASVVLHSLDGVTRERLEELVHAAISCGS